MTFQDTVRPFVTAQTALLAPILYDSVSLGIDGALTRMRGRDLTRYPSQFSGLVRMDVREDLEVRDLPAGWTIGGNPRLMAQLLLVNAEHNLVLRFLKENRANAGGVPHAGSSKARRDVWSRRDMPLDYDFGAHDPDASEPTTFLLLWAPIDRTNLDFGFTLRVVHTIEAGDHVRGVTCDMEIELLQGGAIFNHLKFTGADEAGDLFQIDIAEENDD